LNLGRADPLPSVSRRGTTSTPPLCEPMSRKAYEERTNQNDNSRQSALTHITHRSPPPLAGRFGFGVAICPWSFGPRSRSVLGPKPLVQSKIAD
jgi:hypothetical protein